MFTLLNFRNRSEPSITSLKLYEVTKIELRDFWGWQMVQNRIMPFISNNCCSCELFFLRKKYTLAMDLLAD